MSAAQECYKSEAQDEQKELSIFAEEVSLHRKHSGWKPTHPKVYQDNLELEFTIYDKFSNSDGRTEKGGELLLLFDFFFWNLSFILFAHQLLWWSFSSRIMLECPNGLQYVFFKNIP